MDRPEIRILKEISLKATEESCALIPDLLSFLKHDDPFVVRQSIITGTSLFCAVLTEMALQLRDSNNLERWLEEMWSWFQRFKDIVWGMLEPGSTGSKVLAAKFLENCVLLFTSDGNKSEKGKELNFNVSWLVQGHPTLNPTTLAYEANKIVSFFLGILKSAHAHCGSLVITVINCLASVAKKRPVHYQPVMSALIDFSPDFESSMGAHAASIQYAVRIALLGFIRCPQLSVTESREKLLALLRTKYYGDVTEQSIRQMEKLRLIESHSRESRSNRDDQPSQTFVFKDLTRTRPLIDPADSSALPEEMSFKRTRFVTNGDSNDPINSVSHNKSPTGNDLTPAGQMIVAIGALLAEGDKGAESLELLLSQIHADLFADIVIETMKHFPKSQSALSGRNGSTAKNSETSLLYVSSQTGLPVSSTASTQFSALSSDIKSDDLPSVLNPVADFKRDPRRDPRRLDPRRVPVPAGESSVPLRLENTNDIPDPLHSASNHASFEDVKEEDTVVSVMPIIDFEPSDTLIKEVIDNQTLDEKQETTDDTGEINASMDDQLPSDFVLSPVQTGEQELFTPLNITENEDDDVHTQACDQYSATVPTSLYSEDAIPDIPTMPLYIELTDEQKKTLFTLSVTRIIEDYKQIQASGCGQSRLPLLAHLVAQIDVDDDLITLFQKYIILDYHHNKGHALAMFVLYRLHAVKVSKIDDQSSSASTKYEKFLLSIAKTLLDYLPASDKSFSRLLGEAPILPDSAFKLLEDLCQSCGYDNNTKDASESDRVTQGLGALWSLCLGRPLYRQTCLDIALKCSVHSHDEVRAKAIRLIANKLFLLPYASADIEKFARSMLISIVEQQVSEGDYKHLTSSEQMTDTGSQETSVSGAQSSEVGVSDIEPVKNMPLTSQSNQAVSLSHAHQQTSLLFALCTKRPSLLRLVFDVYGRASKVVKQSIHRHVPGLIRTLGPSSPELLRIISDPPDGSENLITLVLQLMTEESTPSADLIASVKHLYSTKLKDVKILIPMLSSLSKDEVLPIFPRLLDLPLENFQAALARILQGSAHTGPALTPVEVLIAIHDVDPVKDGVPLKKITEACTACFEQRTVFTQNVLAKSLGHMVEQVPLPMLFMRTVIQAMAIFPAMADFVMEILSKLISKQVWKMPKLWVGFLKLVSQTHPNSFRILLQLPPQQLENALNKYPNSRSPLAAYANQPNIRTSLSRHTLQVLGLNDLQHTPSGPFTPPGASQASDVNSSLRGAMLS